MLLIVKVVEVDTIQVTLSLPRDLLGALDIPQSDLEPFLQETVAVELFRQGRISSGKAAEMLGLSKLEFMRLLARQSIPFFTESPGELESEIAATEATLGLSPQ